MAIKTPLDLIPWLEDIFNKHNVDRSYGGAISRNFWAEPRHTKDIDVLVAVKQIAIPSLLESLSIECHRVIFDNKTGNEKTLPIDILGVLDDIRGKGRMTTLLCMGVKVEMFVPFHPFHYRVLERSVLKEIAGRTVKIHTPEDLIVFKKIFDRGKDKEDIKAILASNHGRLDTKRILSDASQLIDKDSFAELEELLRNFYRS